jgi:hypothetical protein
MGFGRGSQRWGLASLDGLVVRLGDGAHGHSGLPPLPRWLGFTTEYDIQLYFRRAKAYSLLWGDPRTEFRRLGDLLFTAPVMA